MDEKTLQYKMLNLLKIVVVLIGTILQFYDLYTHSYTHDFVYNPIIFSIIAIIMILVERKYVIFGFLLSTFALITAWRLSSLIGMHYVIYIYAIAFIIAFIQFIVIAKSFDFHEVQLKNSYDWHLTFIRMYLGYDLIPHFCEKLFAGSYYRNIDVDAFTRLGVNNPAFMVILAGIIEFLGSLSLSCGILTRLSSIGLFVYLIIATIMGHHFALGFIWASKGGGWEYPMLWSAIILSFAFFRPTSFSIDSYVANTYKLPKFISPIVK